MQAKLRVSAPRRSQLIGSTLAAHLVRDLPLPMTVQGAILGPHNRAESGECRVHTFEPALLRNAQPRRYPIHANSSSISSPAAHTSRRVTWLLCMRSAKR